VDTKTGHGSTGQTPPFSEALGTETLTPIRGLWLPPLDVKTVKKWHRRCRGSKLATRRFETDPGKQAQVDWGSSWVSLGDERVRGQMFVIVLGSSRRVFARGYRSEGWDALLAWIQDVPSFAPAPARSPSCPSRARTNARTPPLTLRDQSHLCAACRRRAESVYNIRLVHLSTW
jgi:hypothetical protein